MKNKLPPGFTGKKIKEGRISKGYSQEEFAEMLGLTRVSIINIEAGRHRPQVDRFYIICCILGIEPNDMFPPIKTVEIKHVNKTIIKKKIKRSFKIVKV